MVLGFLVMKRLMKSMSGESSEEEARAAAAHLELLSRLRKAGRKDFPPLDAHEQKLLADVVFPDQLAVGFKDVGGLDSIKESIYETVLLPLQNPQLFASTPRAMGAGAGAGAGAGSEAAASDLLSAPKGVLFYGPPGTGKTMMARAIAKECGCTFINVKMSTLQDKWYGESLKLVRALFSVARKFAPTILFIDEIDVFLRQRSGGGGDHEASGQIKGEFMQLWDGLATQEANSRLVVIGATNRPFDVDKAILRRMPRQFCFDLPDLKERQLILDVVLKGQTLSADCRISAIAEMTEGYSGSDLKELCRLAAMIPVREVIRRHKERIRLTDPDGSPSAAPAEITEKPRPVTLADFADAMQQVKPTGASAAEYLHAYDPRTGGTRTPARRS